MKFHPGQIVATPGALEALRDSGHSAADFLDRHLAGDWGGVPPEDARANDFDLKHGGRLLSSYKTAKGVTIWIITESDRSSSTILLPSEY